MKTIEQGQTSKDTFVDENIKSLLPQFETLAEMRVSDRKLGKGVVRGWHKLAVDVFRQLVEHYPDSETEDTKKEYLSAYSALGRLKKELKGAAKNSLKNPENIYKVNSIINNFNNAITAIMSPYRENYNDRYRGVKQDRARAENRVEIDMSDYILKAEEVLSEPENWTDVSCAIALATGRRMSEVHLSGEFEVSGEYELKFKGQLKGKTRKDDGIALIKQVFTIPTIVKAQLVVDGIQYLEAYKYFGKSQPKRLPKNVETVLVNRTYSKALSEAVKDRWYFIGEETTYHKFRAAYLRLSLINEGVDPFDYLRFAKSIMGDDDAGTLEAYQRYHIKPDTLTRA